MPRFLIEVTEPERRATRRIRDSVRTAGSHFATHADWRRADGMCTGTIIVEADDGRSALAVVPPGMRSDARVFRLQAVAA
jgi:hypothetical protein